MQGSGVNNSGGGNKKHNQYGPSLHQQQQQHLHPPLPQQSNLGASPPVSSASPSTSGATVSAEAGSSRRHHTGSVPHQQQQQQQAHRRGGGNHLRPASASASAGRPRGTEEDFNNVSGSAAGGTSRAENEQQQQQQHNLEYYYQQHRRRDPLGRPAVALSASIMNVYKNINIKFCNERRLAVPGPKYNNGFDDGDGHYIPIIGEEIGMRYMVQEIIGRGSYGVVLRCRDNKYLEPVALKVIRRGSFFMEQGRYEAEIVSYLNQNPLLSDFVVKLYKAFTWKQHIIIVFELLSCDLFKLIQYTNYNGVSLDLTRKFAYQLLTVLHQLEQHRPPIIHCDIKPENVLLRNPSRSGVQVSDFGSSCYQRSREWELPPLLSPILSDAPTTAFPSGSGFAANGGAGAADAVDGNEGAAVVAAFPSSYPVTVEAATTYSADTYGAAAVMTTGVEDEVDGGGNNNNNNNNLYCSDGVPLRAPLPPQVAIPKYIQSRYYRSPEVILELGCTTTAIDRWSLGCMLVELHTGLPLFPGSNEAEMIGLFTAILGPLPQAMIAASPKRHMFFEKKVVSTPRQRSTSASTATTLGAAGFLAKGGGSRGKGAATAVAVGTRHVDPEGLCSSTAGVSSSGKGQIKQQQHRLGGLEGSAKDRRPPSAGMATVAADAGVSTGNPSSGAFPRHRPATAGCTFTTQYTMIAATSGGGSSSGIHHTRGSSTGNTATTTTTTATTTTVTTSTEAAAAVQRRDVGTSPPSLMVYANEAMAFPSTAAAQFIYVPRFQPDLAKFRPLEEAIGVYAGGPRGCRKGQSGHDITAYLNFFSFIKGFLAYDPRERVSCLDASKHAFMEPLMADLGVHRQQQQQQQQ